MRILNAWRAYSDPEPAAFYAQTDAPHNTVTPILRKKGDLVEPESGAAQQPHRRGASAGHLPSARRTLHHIKKENIGLIEVMGLFILPGRLLNELGDAVEDYLDRRSRADERRARTRILRLPNTTTGCAGHRRRRPAARLTARRRPSEAIPQGAGRQVRRACWPTRAFTSTSRSGPRGRAALPGQHRLYRGLTTTQRKPL